MRKLLFAFLLLVGSCASISQEQAVEELSFYADIAQGVADTYEVKEKPDKAEKYAKIANALRAIRNGVNWSDPEGGFDLEIAVTLALQLVEPELKDPEAGPEMVALWAVLRRLQRQLQTP